MIIFTMIIKTRNSRNTQALVVLIAPCTQKEMTMIKTQHTVDLMYSLGQFLGSIGLEFQDLNDSV